MARLMEESRAKNTEIDVTGILLHVKDTFFQILEGPEEVVRDLYKRILDDTRHTHVTQIIFEVIPKRSFGDSRMNLATLNPAELATICDEASLEHLGRLLDGLDEGRAKRLLRAFTDGRWRHHVRAPVAVAASA